MIIDDLNGVGMEEAVDVTGGDSGEQDSTREAGAKEYNRNQHILAPIVLTVAPVRLAGQEASHG